MRKPIYAPEKPAECRNVSFGKIVESAVDLGGRTVIISFLYQKNRKMSAMAVHMVGRDLVSVGVPNN